MLRRGPANGAAHVRLVKGTHVCSCTSTGGCNSEDAPRLKVH